MVQVPAKHAVWLLAAVLLLAVAVGGAPGRAEAAAVLKAGPTAYTNQGRCFSEAITPAYSQQTAPGGSAGTEPRVGDVFYLSVRIDFLSSFECAADFASVLVTLPPNVAPAIEGSLVPICRRFGQNTRGQNVEDVRAARNCPTNVTFNPTTRQFRINPINSPELPDVGGPAGSRWYMGFRQKDAQEYPSVQLLVPVKATATMAARNIDYFVCAVGTSCATARVPLTVIAAPTVPTVTFPASVTTSRIGARIPFALNAGPTDQYVMVADAATNPNFTSGRPCAGLPYRYPPVGLNYIGSDASELQFGDLQQGGTPCNLAPATRYFVKVCTAQVLDPPAVFEPGNAFSCNTTSFTTGASSSPPPGGALGPARISGLALAAKSVKLGKSPALRFKLSRASKVELTVLRSTRACVAGRCGNRLTPFAAVTQSRKRGLQTWTLSRPAGKRWQRGSFLLTVQPQGGAVSKALALGVR